MKEIIIQALKNAIDLNKDGKIDEKDLLEIIRVLLPLIAKKGQKNENQS